MSMSMSNDTPEGTPEGTNHWPGLATKRCVCGYPAEVDSTHATQDNGMRVKLFYFKCCHFEHKGPLAFSEQKARELWNQKYAKNSNYKD